MGEYNWAAEGWASVGTGSKGTVQRLQRVPCLCRRSPGGCCLSMRSPLSPRYSLQIENITLEALIPSLLV